MKQIINNTAFYIISPCKSNLTTEQNKNRIIDMEHVLRQKNIKFKLVNGCYKNVKEVSFFILEQYSFGYLDAYKLSKEFTQESFLYVDTNRRAYLVDCNNSKNLATTKMECIGNFTQVCKDTAEKTDNYTYDPINNGYYICL